MKTSCGLLPVYFMPMPVYFMPMPVYFMPMPVYFMPMPVYFMPMPVYFMPMPVYFMPMPVYFMPVYFLVSVSLYFLTALMLGYTRILILHLDPKCIICFIGITVYYFSLTLSAFTVSKDVELRRNITKSTKANNDPITKISSAQETLKFKEKILCAIDHNKEQIEQTHGISSSLTDEDLLGWLIMQCKR